MQRLTLLRTLGACIAAALAVYTALSFYGDLERPAFRASDVFLGRAQPVGASAGLAAHLSVDGDLLANSAAVKVAKVFRTPAGDPARRAEETREAQDAVVAALQVSPIRPALWLALGMLRTGSSSAAPALKMSYLTGTVPADVAFARLQIVTSTPAASDEEIRLLASSDLRTTLANAPRFEAPLISTYVKATPDGKSLLRDAAQAIDPKFSATLRRY